MARNDAWMDWGSRLQAHVREGKKTWTKIAEDCGQAESTIRSWRNGTREINLTDFFNLCDAAQADPALILFGPVRVSEEQRKLLGDVVVSILESDTAANADYGTLITKIKKARKV